MGTSKDEYIRNIREDLDDFPQINQLLNNEEEFSEKAIERALEKALSRFNNSPPLIGSYTLEAFPRPALLVDMAIVALLERALYHRGRNSLQYSDARLSIDDKNFQLYRTMLNDMRKLSMSEAKELKMALNFSRGWGSIGSVYNGT